MKISVIVEVGEQALAGEQAGRGVALVVFHNVRSVVGVEDLGGVLANLFEGLLLEFDLDAGLLFEDFDSLVPRLALRGGRFLVVLDLDGGGVLLLCDFIAATTASNTDHGRNCKSSGDKFASQLHRFLLFSFFTDERTFRRLLKPVEMPSTRNIRDR